MNKMESLVSAFRYRPVKIEFAGLVGDTVSMARSGWELNLECSRRYDRYSFTLRFAGVNRALNLRIMSAIFEISEHAFRDPIDTLKYMDGICTRIDHCATSLMVATKSLSDSVMSVNWNGMIGTIEPELIRHFSVEEVFHFPSNDKTILIPENKIWTIEEHLNAIRKAQEPFQDELLRMNEFKKTENTKLKLIGVA